VIATHVLGNLLGYFRTAVGHDLNEVVRWWDFADLNDRAQRRAALWEDPEWLDFAPRVPRPRAPAQSTADANRVVTGPLNRRL
jgi:hypothetical protein